MKRFYSRVVTVSVRYEMRADEWQAIDVAVRRGGSDDPDGEFCTASWWSDRAGRCVEETRTWDLSDEEVAGFVLEREHGSYAVADGGARAALGSIEDEVAEWLGSMPDGDMLPAIAGFLERALEEGVRIGRRTA